MARVLGTLGSSKIRFVVSGEITHRGAGVGVDDQGQGQGCRNVEDPWTSAVVKAAINAEADSTAGLMGERRPVQHH